MLKENKDLVFYNSFHKNKYNKLLHVIGIPLIVWSTFLITHKIKINTKLSTVLYLTYLFSYLKISKFYGLISGLFYYLLYYHSHNLYKTINKKKLIHYFAGAQLFSWFIQFYGHKYYEKNRPALLTGFVQSFTMAPLFAVYHFCEFLTT